MGFFSNFFNPAKKKSTTKFDPSGKIHLNPTAEQIKERGLTTVRPTLSSKGTIVSKPEEKEKRGFVETIQDEWNRPVFEGKTIEKKVISAITSPKMTVALATILGTLLGGSAITSRLALRTGIARTTGLKAIAGRGLIPAGRLKTSQIIGKQLTPFEFGKFQARAGASAARFATNAKSSSLTTKILLAGGISMWAASMAKDIIGTYPFGGFIKEESLQAVGFPITKAMDAGDYEGAQLLLDASNELLNMDTSKIPYKNVQDNLNEYFKVQEKANTQWQRLIDEGIAQQEGGIGQFESPFEKSARESAERSAKVTEDIEARDVKKAKEQKAIGEDIAARDVAEIQKFAKIEEDKAAEDVADNLFFPSLEKAKLGIELTPEEVTALNERGYPNELIAELKAKAERFKGGGGTSESSQRSTVRF